MKTLFLISVLLLCGCVNKPSVVYKPAVKETMCVDKNDKGLIHISPCSF